MVWPVVDVRISPGLPRMEEAILPILFGTLYVGTYPYMCG